MQPRRREVGAQVGQQQAHGAQDAGIARHQDAADLQLPRQPRGMQRPGAAERHQRVVARIVAALHGDHADRARHVGGDDREDALRGLPWHAEAQPARPAARSPLGQILPDRHAPAQQMLGFSVCSTTLASVTVGSSLPRAVADRAGIGAGAARPDLQQPAAVDIGDRAAARADGVDVEHRRLDRIAVHDGFAGEPAAGRPAAAPRRWRCRPCRR